MGHLRYLRPQSRHMGYFLLLVTVLFIFHLIDHIIQENVSVGYSAIPVAILLGLLFVFSYILIKNPEPIEWDVPYLGTLKIGSDSKNGHRSSKEGFERVAAVADEESTELADALRVIRHEFDETTCEAVAETLVVGIESRKTSPFHQTLHRLESLLDARDFVEESESLEMRIVQREDERLYAKVTEEHGEVKEGLEFDIYILDTINVDGEAETVSKQVATAEVVLVDEQVCGLEIIDWSEDFEPSEGRIAYLMNHTPEARFDTQMTRNVDWDDIEMAHENLTQLETGGNRHDAD